MQQWYVHENGATTGPFSTEQVKDSIKAGKIGAEATYCVTGATTFRPIADHPELAPPAPTVLPIAATPKQRCACPVARCLVKALIIATIITGATFAAKKLGLCHCHKQPAIKPL